MSHVSGFQLAMRMSNKTACKAMTEKAWDGFKDHGKVTSFRMEYGLCGAGPSL